MAGIVGELQYFRALVSMEIKKIDWLLRKEISSSNQQVRLYINLRDSNASLV